MNKRSKLVLSVAVATLFHMNLVAHPGHDHGPSDPPAQQEDHGRSHSPGEAHDHSHPHPHPHGEDHDQSPAEMIIPKDLRELWGQINLRTEQLKATLEKGEHEKLHEIDEALSALLRALPEDLTANIRRRVEGQVNNLVRILDRIHDQADAENAEGAQRQWQVFSRTLPLLARHYPEKISSHKAKETLRSHLGHGHSHAPGQNHQHEAQESSGPAQGEARVHPRE